MVLVKDAIDSAIAYIFKASMLPGFLCYGYVDLFCILFTYETKILVK